ncbi:hypothetical protein NDU88_003465 [Pleurodeles waltl]|uniref:Uncharacterized protein n=1 Tax=Pleurodeles waltl TaxID=8319 RepID=A0AAV7MR86_PLEWA|nr:hypothetical protein NDU88_003465 [Pleurodeles waltl]
MPRCQVPQVSFFVGDAPVCICACLILPPMPTNHRLPGASTRTLSLYSPPASRYRLALKCPLLVVVSSGVRMAPRPGPDLRTGGGCGAEGGAGFQQPPRPFEYHVGIFIENWQLMTQSLKFVYGSIARH